MPIVSGFYNSVNGDRRYDAEQFGSLLDGIIREGVFPSVGNKFIVRAVQGSMRVTVDTGKAWLFGHWVENTGPETLTVSAAYSASDRKDYVCITIDRATASRSAKLHILKDTELSLPANQDTAERKTYKIAEINVLRGTTRLGQEHIKNLVGNGLPYVAGVAMNVDLHSLEARLEAEYNVWFQNVRDALAQAGGNNAADIANLKTTVSKVQESQSFITAQFSNVEKRLSDFESRFNNRSTFFDFLDTTNGGTHNSIYRGDHLGSSVNSTQRRYINDGTFKGLWLGDYWQFGGITWRIVAFDYFRNVGWPPWDRAHLVVVPDQCLYKAAWDRNQNTSNGYAGSTLNSQDIGTAVNRGAQMFGQNLNSPWHRFSKKVDNGIVSEIDWYGSPRAAILNEEMLFGRNMQSYSQATHAYTNFAFLAQGQLPAFHMNPALINMPKERYWLQDISNSQWAFCMDSDGVVTRAPADYSYGIRPYYVITA